MARTTYKVTIAGREFSLDYRLGSKGTVRDVEREVRTQLKDPHLSFANAYFDLLGCSEVQAAIVWGGIKADLEKGATVEDVMDLLAKHIEQGGDLIRVMKQVRRAVLSSGVVGEFSIQEINKIVKPDEAEPAAVPQ